MADLLRIRKGLFGSLPTDKVAGTIYVTTDEKAMYVDVDSSTRIRLGQIIEVPNLTAWQNLKPPYSQEGFYYIVDDNALIKYTGDGTNHSWRQINAPTDLSGLTTRIGNLETVVGNANSGLVKDVNALKTTVGDENSGLVKQVADIDDEIGENTSGQETGIYKLIADNAKAIAQNKTAIESNDTDITNLDTRLTDAEEGIGNNATAIANNATAISENASDITDLRDDLGTNDKTDGSTAFTRIAALEGSVATNTSDITTNANAIKTLQNSDTKQNESIEKLNTTVYGNANGTQSTTTGLVVDVQGLRTDLGNKSEDNDGSGSAFARIADLRGKITTNTTNIGKNATAIGKNASDISALTTTVNSQGESITALTGRVKTAEDEIDALQGTVGNSTTGLVKQVNDLDTTINGNNGILKTIGSSNDAASASGSLYARINQNKADIATNRQSITDLGALVGTRSAAQADKTAFQLIDEKVDKTTYATDKEALEKKIDDEILAVNAMRYISTTGAIPTGTFSIGDTYVASTIIYNVPTDASGATTTTAYPGDLLIANGTELTTGTGVGTIDPATLYWDVVDTGYNTSHEDKLLLDNNVVSLESYAGTPLGSVKFAGAGSTKVASAAAANGNPPTVTISVEWEDF